jgi:hypothetical protein
VQCIFVPHIASLASNSAAFSAHGKHIKVMLSLYRRGRPLRAPGDLGFQNSYTLGKRMWQSCQPYAPAAFTHRIFIQGTHFCSRLSRPQGHGAAGGIKSIKNPNYNHRESNPRPFGLWCSASINMARTQTRVFAF